MDKIFKKAIYSLAYMGPVKRGKEDWCKRKRIRGMFVSRDHISEEGYVMKKGEIYLCPAGLTIKTLTHELAHRFWHEVMSYEERLKYNDMFEKCGDNILCFERKYGMNNVREDFATQWESLYKKTKTPEWLMNSWQKIFWKKRIYIKKLINKYYG